MARAAFFGTEARLVAAPEDDGERDPEALLAELEGRSPEVDAP